VIGLSAKPVDILGSYWARFQYAFPDMSFQKEYLAYGRDGRKWATVGRNTSQ